LTYVESPGKKYKTNTTNETQVTRLDLISTFCGGIGVLQPRIKQNVHLEMRYLD